MMTTSRRLRSALVALWRSRSISSLIELSFSMYVSLDGHVRLGLVVVVVGDEVLDPVLGEELPELGGELRGEALVRRQDQRGPLHLGDEARDGEGLAGPGDAQERLVPVPRLDARGQLRDRLRLVARRLEVRHQLEFRHEATLRRGCDTHSCRPPPTFVRLRRSQGRGLVHESRSRAVGGRCHTGDVPSAAVTAEIDRRVEELASKQLGLFAVRQVLLLDGTIRDGRPSSCVAVGGSRPAAVCCGCSGRPSPSTDGCSPRSSRPRRRRTARIDAPHGSHGLPGLPRRSSSSRPTGTAQVRRAGVLCHHRSTRAPGVITCAVRGSSRRPPWRGRSST